MRRILGLIAVLGVVVFARLLEEAEDGAPGKMAAMMEGTTRDFNALAAMALGFVLIVAFLVGQSVVRLGLPSITGYLLVGMIFGPHLLGRVHYSLAVLGADAVGTLQLLDAVALGLIALSAGGELKWAVLRKRIGAISWVLGGQTLSVMGGTILLLALTHHFFPFHALQGISGGALAATVLLLAVIALANSPATALAIIQETRSRGAVSEIVLGVTVIKDVVVISLFTLVLALAPFIAAIQEGAAGEAQGVGSALTAMMWLGLLWEIAGSILAGLVLGWLVGRYMERIGAEMPLIVLAVSFGSVTLLPAWHLSGILACMVAGFYLENYSPHGEKMMRAIEHHALPVYVVFFTIAGASLDLNALALTLNLALFLAFARLLLTVLGTGLGGWMGGAGNPVVFYGWSGFVAQAGVTLGFALLIGERLPQFGEQIKTIVLAGVVINQLLGPVLFRWGLWRAGEMNARNNEVKLIKGHQEI